MRFLYLLPLVLASCSVAAAQQTGRGIISPTTLEFISQQIEKGTSSVAGVRGTPMLAPNWTQGRVRTGSGWIGPVWLKYNLASGQLLWRRPTGDSLDLNTAQISEFVLGDSLRGEKTTFRRYLAARIEAQNLRTAFFEVRYDAGRAALLRQRTKQIDRSAAAGPSLTEGRPPSWQVSLQYYVKRADNKVLPVRLNEKSVLEALGPAQQPALVAYAKREHLSLKKEDDLVKLLAYYDTL